MTNKLAAINPNELMAYIDTLYEDHYKQAYDQTIHDIFNAVKRRIRRCAALDVAEIKRGQWLYNSGSGKYFCSVCDEPALSFKKDTLYGGDLYEVCLTDYCPECGAKMID